MTEPTRPAGAATRSLERPGGADAGTETPEGATGRQAPTCALTVLGLPHWPHDWTPQPGMTPVRCTGVDPDCPSCDAGIDHTVHCPTPETHNYGCPCGAGTQRLTADTVTDDALDTLYARLERAEAERNQARLLVAASEMPGHTLRLAALYPEIRADRDRARDTAVALENELTRATDQLAAVRALADRWFVASPAGPTRDAGRAILAALDTPEATP